MPEQMPELGNILHSGALSGGVWVRTFERSVASFTGAPHVAATSSFGAAMQIALMTLGVGHGDEVVTSAQSCLASNMPILTVGARAVWADIDPLTGTLCPDDVRRRITPRTRAIVHNHHCGYPGHMDEIAAIGREKGVPVIDDCIEAFGARYRGRAMGAAAADAAVFSFQTVRLPNTIDGGAVCFRDAALHEKACRLRDLGVDRATFRDAEGEISPLSDVPVAGLGATMNEVSGYIGCCQMEAIEQLLRQQRGNARVWLDELETQDDYRPIGRGGIEPNYWVFGALARKGRDEGIRHFRSRGFHASGVHLPNYYYSAFGNGGDDLRGTREFHERFVAVPCGWWMQGASQIKA